MDPNATLAEIREAIRVFREKMARGAFPAATEAAVDLADSFAALDEWMTKGGFMPSAWRAGK